MWDFIKRGVKNVACNAFTDKDGDFCTPTFIGFCSGVGMMVAFFIHGSTDFVALGTGEATIIAAVAGKRWSENR